MVNMSKKREWLIQMRKESGMTTTEVAKELGITQQYFSWVEIGKRRPSPELAQKIANLFDFKWTRFYQKDN